MRVSSVLLVVLAVCLAGVTVPVAAVGGSSGASPATASPIAPATAQADAPQVAQQETPNGTNETTDEGSDGSTAGEESAGFGSRISSFMQSSSTQTSGAVESRLWEVRVNRTAGEIGTTDGGVSGPVVERRVSVLESRLTEVRETRQRLAEARANGSLSAVEYRARLARVNGQLSALESAVDRTRPVAVDAGLNETRLSDLSAEIEAERGPPDWAGNRSAGDESEGNGNGPPEGGDGGPGNGAGPPGNGNGGDRGNAGNGNGNDNAGNGNGDDRGNAGNGNSGNDGNGNGGDRGNGGGPENGRLGPTGNR
ncbi:hypothetical protein [Salinirubrum litoreum]|uniref:Uncharacterized protein n=1 Tax=Salinirubrum litoreum TaxID=1126234 RepID=A0ABD5R786_9EURY|nr:hypothetical protein [Salinirubrum litoreum]